MTNAYIKLLLILKKKIARKEKNGMKKSKHAHIVDVHQITKKNLHDVFSASISCETAGVISFFVLQ
jgi:hypothetical protein